MKTSKEVKTEFIEMVQSFMNKNLACLSSYDGVLALSVYSDGNRKYEEFHLGYDIDYISPNKGE